MKSIEPFLDETGKIKQLPTKKIRREEVLRYLGEKFGDEKTYTEKEVNAIIDDWHTFNDYFLLRRELIIAGVLARTSDGSKYWLVPHEN